MDLRKFLDCFLVLIAWKSLVKFLEAFFKLCSYIERLNLYWCKKAFKKFISEKKILRRWYLLIW